MWAACLLSIRFDVEEGAIIEHVSPDILSPQAQQLVVDAAFPDSNFECDYNFIYNFTVRNVVNPESGLKQLYGCAYYRQKRDQTVPRGCVQQVFVLLSFLPYHMVHELILRVVAPRCSQCCLLSPDRVPTVSSSSLAPTPCRFFPMDCSFNKEHYTVLSVIDRAMEEMSRWPQPMANAIYQVTLLSQTLQFATPSHAAHYVGVSSLSQGGGCRTSPLPHKQLGQCIPQFLPSSHEVSTVLPLFALLYKHLHHLTKLWELLIAHKSIFIISDTSSCASGVARGVCSLIAPLRFNGQLHSHLTSKHEDLERLRRMGKEIGFDERKSVVVASTNRMLLKHFDAWPCWVAVHDRSFLPSSQSQVSLKRLLTDESCLSLVEPAHTPSRPTNVISLTSPHAGTALWPGTDSPSSPLDGREGEWANNASEVTGGPLDGVPPAVAPAPRSANSSQEEDEWSRQYFFRSSSSEGGAASDCRSPFSTGRGDLDGFGPCHRRFDSSLTPYVCSRDMTKECHSSFTRAELQEVLNAQVLQAPPGSVEAARETLQRKPGNYFDSGDYSFVLNHTTLIESLTQQLEKISQMDAAEKEVAISLQLEQLYGGLLTDAITDRAVVSQLKEFLSSTILSQHSVADDAVRRFFRSLTMEFLHPIEVWFMEDGLQVPISQESRRKGSVRIFELCDAKIWKERLSSKRFMDYLGVHHRKLVGTSMKGGNPYSVCAVLYERFSQGSLFQEFLEQQFDLHLRKQVVHFNLKEWERLNATEEQRLALFFSFLRVIIDEVENRLDPDMCFVEKGYAVLCKMSTSVSQSITEDLMKDFATKWGIAGSFSV